MNGLDILLRRCHLLLLLLVLPGISFATTPPQHTIAVRYGGHERHDYYTDLLRLALSYASGNIYHLQASELDLPKQRAFDLMNAHQGIDVLFGSVSTTRLQQYHGVPFGILRGYNGWRIALVHKKSADILRSIHSKQHLRRVTLGQFLTWSDTTILRANGLTVETSTDIQGLYGVLQRGRIDAFPLSAIEIEHELTNHPNADLMIDPHLLIYYPTATWFYVAKDNEKLGKVLLQGLQQA